MFSYLLKECETLTTITDSEEAAKGCILMAKRELDVREDSCINYKVLFKKESNSCFEKLHNKSFLITAHTPNNSVHQVLCSFKENLGNFIINYVIL